MTGITATVAEHYRRAIVHPSCPASVLTLLGALVNHAPEEVLVLSDWGDVHVPAPAPVAPDTQGNVSGRKYLRPIQGAIDGHIDIYGLLLTFDVRCPARQHAIKKLACAGLRGKGDELQDLREARDAVTRAIQLIEQGT